MAPAARGPRKKETNFFEYGVKGRTTGLTLEDTGIRDENGFETMDNLFSSPEKSTTKGRPRKNNSAQKNANATISSSEAMDVGDSTIPEITDVLDKRASLRLPPPRSKSPIKTFLNSPARRNPSMGLNSSPTRGGIVEPRSASVSASVRRKLDFSNAGDDASSENATAPKRAGSALPALGRLTNGTHLKPLKQPLSADNTSFSRDEFQTAFIGDEDTEDAEDSMQMVNGAGEDSYQMIQPEDDTMPPEEEVDEPEPEPEPKPARRGKRKSSELAAPVEPAKKGRRGRRKKDAVLEEEPQEEQAEEPQQEEEEEEKDVKPAKKSRRSLDEAPKEPKNKGGRPKKTVEAEKPEKPAKTAGRSRQGGEASNAPKAKGKAPKSKLAAIAEEDASPAVKRGPPLPKSRGLFILRRETPAEGIGFKQTRSGRNSIKPLAFWRNERVEYSEDENDDGSRKFVLPRIKEVVRNDEVEEPRKKRYNSYKSKSSKKRTEADEDDEALAEPWEAEPGRIEGDVRSWDPEDQTGVDAGLETVELAFSSAAIVTQVVKDGSFKFAKTLTLPFFGSGMLDLRPGDKKKAKYSRKMQMVFFVHFGRVKVMVSGDNEFRIGKGGMWQVPRGNLYSIENDYDQPARIFFAQGCDVSEEEAT